ncbi:DUF1376 domain-containing protein [Methylobacterium mesophilicum]|uniref:DUF1376 domain-containing protein n=1 Tax=Methylobacterium mesophilicum TaxID=39956 RepID=UPI002F35637C
MPADIDVDGIHGFLLHTDRLFHSELWALSTGDEFKGAVALWCHAWRQRPAGSLPDDDRLLAAFSGAGPRWKKVRTMALRGFVLCADGRYYHRVLCEDVLRAAEAKDARRERTAAATRARQRKDDPETTPPGGEKPSLFNEAAERDDDRYDQRNDSRDDRRDETVTVATRGPLRPLREGEEEGKKKDIPAAACDPVPREATAPAWNSRASFDRVEARCRTALPPGWCLDPVVGPMARLEADGLDLEREIVPAILDIAASRRVPIRTWGLLADAVAESVAAQRRSRSAQGLSAVPPAPVPPDEMIDLPGGLRWPEADLRTWIT